MKQEMTGFNEPSGTLIVPGPVPGAECLRTLTLKRLADLLLITLVKIRIKNRLDVISYALIVLSI